MGLGLEEPPSVRLELPSPVRLGVTDEGGNSSSLGLKGEGHDGHEEEEGNEGEEDVYRWPELICVYVAIIADAVVSNVIAPYAVTWVRDSFGGRNVGLKSGLLVGSFTFATAVSSPFFGWLSDIVGRRVLMAGGLFSSGVLTLIGGLSGHYWVTFSMRFLAGLLDASQTVSFAAIGDLTTGDARFVAFGYSKAASQIAKILTSLIGGLTYDVKPDPIFRNLPGYNNVLLSHMIAFGSCLVGTLLIILLYREGPEFTHVTQRIRRVKSMVRQQSIKRDDSALSLLSSMSNSSDLIAAAADKEEEGGGGAAAAEAGAGIASPSQQQQHVHFHSAPSPPTNHASSHLRQRHHRGGLLSGLVPHDEVTFDDEPTLLRLMASRLSSTAGGHAEQPMPLGPPLLPRGNLSSSLAGRPSFWEGVQYVVTNPLLLRLILVYSICSFCNGGLFLSISMLAQASGGYDMSPKDSSIIFLFFGSWAIVFNAFFFKGIVARLGQKRANGIGLILTGVGVLGLPIGDYFIRSHTVKLWIVIVVTVLVFCSGYMLINSILASFISLHASSEMQGITQGIAMFASQILSGLGPIVFGELYNRLESPIAVFMCLTAGYLLSFFALLSVPCDVLEKKGKGAERE